MVDEANLCFGMLIKFFDELEDEVFVNDMG